MNSPICSLYLEYGSTNRFWVNNYSLRIISINSLFLFLHVKQKFFERKNESFTFYLINNKCSNIYNSKELYPLIRNFDNFIF